MRRLAARTAWLGLYILVAVTPLALAWAFGTPPDGPAAVLSVGTGIVALSLLAIVLVLPARVRSLVSAFGIEQILRGHRMLALAAAILVVAHLVLALATDPRGIAVLDLRDTTAAAWAATISTLALIATIALALRRRRRQPRYEGWRLSHIALAAIVLVAAWLHVWWIDQLVEHPLIATWFILLAAAVFAIAMRRWVWIPWRAHRRSYVVEEIRPVAGDAVTLVVRAHGHEGLPFRAGQFAWLKIGSSSFVFEEHPFTIASTAEQPDRKEFTIKAAGDFSELLRGLRPGRRVFLDGPYGAFSTDGLESSEGFVLIAGGVGITPMLSMLRTLSDRRDGRHHELIIGARSLEDLMLRDEIHSLRRHLDLEVTEIVESPQPEWGGETGLIDAKLLDRRLPTHARHHDYFLCGPPPMVASVGHDLRELGIPTRRIHTERFEVV